MMRTLCAIGLMTLLSALSGMGAHASALFEEKEVIPVTLTGPFSALLEDRQASDEQAFALEARNQSHAVEVRLRGHSRRGVCDLPPLRLSFSTRDTGNTVFEGQDTLKLVTHCRHGDRGEQDMLEEYLAYRLFNVLTQYGLRVRLLRLEYRDTGDDLPRSASPRYGFLLEPVAALARRTGAQVAALPGVPIGRYDRDQAALMFVFQYLIGNTDWSLVTADHETDCCHNMELLERDGRVVLVPYDFDLAGLVNAPYAFPDATLRIRRVTQRLYRGLCIERTVLWQAIRTINGLRDEILALPADIPGLEPGKVKSARKYLEGFFERAEDEEKLLDQFERRCLGS